MDIEKASGSRDSPPPQYDAESLGSGSSEDDEGDRKAWGGQIEFILTCVGYAVGLGNVWRFPYLCYKNGGGAFLIPYIIMLFLVGFPLFFLELSFGQFASLGPITIWKANPLFKGVGYASVMVSFVIALYYNVIIAYCLLFFFKSMAAPVPWADCNQPWNTDRCIDADTQARCNLDNTTCPGAILNTTEMVNATGSVINVTTVILSNETYTTPSEEFFYTQILKLTDGMGNADGMQWEILGCLALAWVIVTIVLVRGISSLGKVVYFTALFPYVLLTILLVKGATLPGSLEGVIFYINPKWDQLGSAQAWSDAAVQIFYSLGVASGGLIAMASYNKFHNNCLRDSLIVPFVNCGTSIYSGFVIFSVLGYMSQKKLVDIDKVADKGPGLAFVVYPEALSTMPLPTLWSILFFFMMVTLGFSSQFSMWECVLTALLDEFPILKSSKKHEIIFRISMSCLGFLLGVPMCTHGGFYLFNLVDNYSGGFPLLIVGATELIAISWAYGYARFSDDITMMLGKPPNIYFRICWQFVSPGIMIVVTIVTAIQYKPLEFRGYDYPLWASAIGWMIVVGTTIYIPFFALRAYCEAANGVKYLKRANSPTVEWGPANAVDRRNTSYQRDEDIRKKRSPRATAPHDGHIQTGDNNNGKIPLPDTDLSTDYTNMGYTGIDGAYVNGKESVRGKYFTKDAMSSL